MQIHKKTIEIRSRVHARRIEKIANERTGAHATEQKNAEHFLAFRLRVNDKVRLQEIKMSVFYLSLDAKTCRLNSFPLPPFAALSLLSPYSLTLFSFLVQGALTQSHFLCSTAGEAVVGCSFWFKCYETCVHITSAEFIAIGNNFMKLRSKG